MINGKAREHDWFRGYPEPKEPRIVGPHMRTIQNRIAASYRDQEFYDGARANGYGGMVNDGRWEMIAKQITDEFGSYRRVLQLPAHKGFLLYELFKCNQRVYGQETSEYAARNSLIRLDVSPFTTLPYEDELFDLVIAPSAVYMHNLVDAIKVLREIERVKKKDGGKSFITLAAYEDESDIEGLMLLRYWFLLGTTILTKADWIAVMEHAGYSGDYRFDTAEYLNLVKAVQPECAR